MMYSHEQIERMLLSNDPRVLVTGHRALADKLRQQYLEHPHPTYAKVIARLDADADRIERGFT